jgi:flagellar biogenesis protein FliO
MTAGRPGAVRIAGAAFLLLAAAPVYAQRLGQGTGAEVPVWRVLGALALCLGLAVAAAYFLRRRLGGSMPLAMGRTRRLQLIETLRLSHQVDICLVSCDGGEFLIAATQQGATTINPNVPAPPAPQAEGEPR